MDPHGRVQTRGDPHLFLDSLQTLFKHSDIFPQELARASRPDERPHEPGMCEDYSERCALFAKRGMCNSHESVGVGLGEYMKEVRGGKKVVAWADLICHGPSAMHARYAYIIVPCTLTSFTVP